LRDNPGCPVWQRSYYEHVIRSEAELVSIRQYIADNPRKWDLDENNPVNLK
jgi:REP element-mobilizing transposase RayT